MSAAICIVDDEPQSKEYDSLPMPATTNVSQASSAGSGLKLLQILHYLNPLFYARLVQAYIQAVLESYSAASSSSGAPRITGGEDQPYVRDEVARCTTVDKCFSSTSPEFEYSHRLGLDGTGSHGASTTQMPAHLSDISLHQPEAESSSSGQLSENVASALSSTDSTDTPASTHAMVQDDKAAGTTEGKRARKTKRGKGKGKAKC
ncbi:hypothetical protein GGI20_000313 [Coemansia sp. BCRC 34301]|nr:hypothetical protein GGI20_000313 [Coemansia sp. BCRC 34301]